MGHPKKKLTNLQVVSIEVRQITDVRVEQLTVFADGRRGADSEGSDIFSSQFLGQSANVLDNNGMQKLIEDYPDEIQSMLEGREPVVGAEQTFCQTAKKDVYE